MNTIQSPAKAQSSGASTPDAALRMQRSSRLVVVVPDVAEPGLLAARIHQVAAVGRRGVLLLGVASDRLLDAELRRRLTLVAAFLQDAGTRAEIRVAREGSLLPTLEAVLGADDLLACCVVEGPGVGEVAWLDRLTSWSRRPVCAFLENDAPTAHKPSPVASLAPWLISMAIILGFSWLQVSISQSGTGGLTTGLLIGSVAAEIGLISLSNALLG